MNPGWDVASGPRARRTTTTGHPGRESESSGASFSCNPELLFRASRRRAPSSCAVAGRTAYSIGVRPTDPSSRDWKTLGDDDAPPFLASHAASRGSPRVSHRRTRQEASSHGWPTSQIAESDERAVSPVSSSLQRLRTRVTLAPAFDNDASQSSTASGCTQMRTASVPSASPSTTPGRDTICAGAMTSPVVRTKMKSLASAFRGSTSTTPPSTHRDRHARTSPASTRTHALYEPSCTAHASRTHLDVDRYPRRRPGLDSGSENPHRVRISNRLACHTCVSNLRRRRADAAAAASGPVRALGSSPHTSSTRASIASRSSSSSSSVPVSSASRLASFSVPPASSTCLA